MLRPLSSVPAALLCFASPLVARRALRRDALSGRRWNKLFWVSEVASDWVAVVERSPVAVVGRPRLRLVEPFDAVLACLGSGGERA
eukprot:scaffold271668_cov36-Tisochrysis_lutea.AAC.1